MPETDHSAPAAHEPATGTRLAHLAVAALVAAQLTTGSIMSSPMEGGGGGDVWFLAHRLVGLGAVGAVALLWWAALVRPGRRAVSPGALFPWFSAGRRAALRADALRAARKLRAARLPQAADTGAALAPAVHGLGLLVVAAVALTGALGWFGGLEALLALHSALVTVLWAYLGGHVGVALIHELSGEGRLGYMFLARARARQGSIR
ncbi:cytochrome b/b6 domain-containing protein [Roseomonas sp. E05]|uniref:cytochrome b/b6 domain-containing protein n=1 Tax=Roseomonas sp. E05 TaxID=3046310 RepID=UPI0024BA60AD|nr:cytochrome b/b6 domain-containing protein [Roseomonas sp. E05]MDJ0391013.1 cytochrome b/b6 domain-containing protein [Roseomonas sp. E05]